MTTNSFGTCDKLQVDDVSYQIHRLDQIKTASKLPYSLKVLLENLLRNEDGRLVTREQIQALVDWQPKTTLQDEILYTPARVLLQDFTGVPCVVDLVAMRDAIIKLGGDPQRINPLVPSELVIDHSVIIDVFGQANAFSANSELEFHRNIERYQLLRWGQQAFDNFKVVPPGTGICHQVNLEYLSRVVFTREGPDGMMAYPDTLVGTDSHTPMVNGLGVLGWGVGGIEAEAAMLGQPMSMLIPQVVGVKLTGKFPPGTTATDLVLTVTELLRKTGVVGKFVEFYGPGVANIPLANRATLGNMSPEYGSTCAIFPIDDETLTYMRLTGRPEHQIRLVEAYAKKQGLWHDPNNEAHYSQTVELDLGSLEPSIAGPKRPHDRIPVRIAPDSVKTALHESESIIASDTRTITPDTLDKAANNPHNWPHKPVAITMTDGTQTQLDNGHVVIAAITSCTNTSNPLVMIGAGLLAKRAVEKGLSRKPWVKTSLAPGSRVVTDYYERAGLTSYLDKLGFNLVGYGCTTCIGNSGPLIPEVAAAIDEHKLNVSAMLSGNRNFEGRIHPQIQMNFLASPMLVVAYALTGTMHTNILKDSLGLGSDDKPVFLSDIWPSIREVQEVIDECVQADMFTKGYADVFAGDDNWHSLKIPTGNAFEWITDSTYVRQPPYFDGVGREPLAISDIKGARILAKLGDSVTTDHISPAGTISLDTPAGKYLSDHGVKQEGFNSYGSRRGNHEVMIRGTFANIRLRNQLAPGTEGGFTRDFTQAGAPVSSIYDASVNYIKAGTPLVILAGKEYGSGSSRDWAAKGTALLGVRAVIAQSYERIHRSNLIGMNVLPLQYKDGENADTLGLTGEEIFDITGLSGNEVPPPEVSVRAVDGNGKVTLFNAKVRIDTPVEADYYCHGGILPYMLRQLLDAE